MNASTPSPAPASNGMVWAAFAAIYLIWGSTYLAIRFAVETIPPLLMAGTRFLLAGSLLYAGLRLTGITAPTFAQWTNAAIVGTLLVAIPNGGVCWAEQSISSGLAALLIAVTPVFFAIVNWCRPGGERPGGQTSLGILLGLAGVTLLVTSRGSLRTGSMNQFAVGVILVACLSVAIGSHYSRQTPKPASTLMAVAAQMLCGGGAVFLFGLTLGETSALNAARISGRSLLAFLYLVVFGSLVAFSAFSWLLKVSTPSRLATYAYVNPVIAVFVGWLLGGEVLTSGILWSAVVIILGVVIITSQPNKAPKPVPALTVKSTANHTPNR